MNMMRKAILTILFSLSLTAWSAEDRYPFATYDQQHRFTKLTSQLRCLVCQNQNLADSNAPLANDLREQIYQQIKQGQSDNDIINYLVTRYGDFILYRPPLKFATIGLWFTPLFLLIFSVGFLILYIHKKQRA